MGQQIALVTQAELAAATGESSGTTNVLNFGAKGDGKWVATVTSNSASKVIKCAGASFSGADVNKYGIVYNDSPFAQGQASRIISVQSATELTLESNAGLTLATAGYFVYGTDDSAAINAAFEAAEPEAPINALTNFNSPIGLGQGLVVFPSTKTGGLYVTAAPLVTPSQVEVDMQGMVANLLPSRTTTCWTFKPWSSFRRLYLWALFGGGIQLGEAEKQGEIRGGTLNVWHGNEESGVPAVFLDGTAFDIDNIWIKQAGIGVKAQPSSDSTINRIHAIGCTEGMQVNKANMLHVGVIFLDTCGSESAVTCYGVSVNETSSQVTFDMVHEFQINGSKKVLTSVFATGALGSKASKPSIIRANINAQRGGGTILQLTEIQDGFFTIEGSNNTTSSSNSETKEFTACVAYGTVSGNLFIQAALTGSITPYSGTVAGLYIYTRGSVRYVVTGAAPPTAAAGAKAGSSPTAPTVSGSSNDGKGTVTFHSGTGTPEVGEQVEVKFNNATGYVGVPVVGAPIPLTKATAELGLYISSRTATGFKVSSTKAPGVSETFEFDYAIVG